MSLNFRKTPCEKVHCPYPECDRVLRGKDSLRAHLKSHYRKANILVSFHDTICSICGKKFSSKANALRHKKLHTINHLRCDYRSCYRTFPTPEKLELHQVSHLENDELEAIMGLLMFRSKPKKEVRHRLQTIVTNREYYKNKRRSVK
jgi:hypothetical protein